jgi:hypothetical protein
MAPRRKHTLDCPTTSFLPLPLQLLLPELTPASICFRDAQAIKFVIDHIRPPQVTVELLCRCLVVDREVAQEVGGIVLGLRMPPVRVGGLWNSLRWKFW